MSYAIRLTEVAEHNLSRLPLPVRRYTVKMLASCLAATPAEPSERSAFPYREKCQLYRLDDVDHDGRRWEVCAMFQYGVDEQTLNVVAIGHSSVPLDSDGEPTG